MICFARNGTKLARQSKIKKKQIRPTHVSSSLSSRKPISKNKNKWRRKKKNFRPSSIP